MNGSKYPVTVHLPAEYNGRDVLALLMQVEDAHALRDEIRQLKASRARLIATQETMADELAEARERIAALQTELYRSRAEIDSFENACTALTGCVGGSA